MPSLFQAAEYVWVNLRRRHNVRSLFRVAMIGTPGLEDLMRRAQSGDKRAYSLLFQKIAPLLKAFVARRLSSPADVEDVVQDILLSIHKAGHTYDTDRPFKIWMFTIARYRLNDYLRVRYKRGEFIPVRLEDMITEIPAEDVTPEPDRYEYLHEALEALPEKQKKIVSMMKIEGRSIQDTAQTMDMSVSAVKVAAHRAYKALALKIRNSEDTAT